MLTHETAGCDCTIVPGLDCMLVGSNTTPEEIAHAEAQYAWLRGERPDPPLSTDYCTAALAAAADSLAAAVDAARTTVDVQATLDAVAAEAGVEAPSVAAIRGGGRLSDAKPIAVAALVGQMSGLGVDALVRIRRAQCRPAVVLAADGGASLTIDGDGR